jgi:peroxiredoxin
MNPHKLFGLLLIVLATSFLACQNAQTTATTDTAATDATQVPVNLGPQEEETRNHRIDFEVANFMGDFVIIAYNQGEGKYVQDTLTAQDGKFVLEGEDPLPPGIYAVALPPSNTYFEIVVDKDQVFSIKTDTTDFAGTMQVEGSFQNEIFYGDMAFIAEQRKKVQELAPKLQAAKPGTPEFEQLNEERKKIDQAVADHRNRIIRENPTLLYADLLAAMQDPTVPEAPKDANGQPLDSLFAWKYTREHWWDAVDFSSKGLVRTPALQAKITRYLDNLTYQHPDSVLKSIDYVLARAEQGDYEVFRYCLTTMFNKYVNIELMCWDKVFVYMAEKYYLANHPMIDWPDSTMLADMRERATAMKPTICGEIAPNYTVEKMDGEMISMHSIEAPYTILYFWDYDCGHCKKETPKLAEAYKKYEKDGVALLTLSINGDIGVWKNKIKEYGFTGGIHAQDHRRQSGFDAYYDLRTTPRMFVLDKDKRIIAKRIGAETLEQIFAFEKGKTQ